MFPNVAVAGDYPLPGLELSRGLTKAEHERIHNGYWDENNKVTHGYAPDYYKDRQGHVIEWFNPETGKKQKFAKVDPETGKTIMKPVHNAGHDLPIELDKSWSEWLIANPQHREVLKESMIEAANIMMRVAVLDRVPLIEKTVAKPSEVGHRPTLTQGSATKFVKADGILWFSTFQTGSRPTPESEARGYADPQVHLHIFLSSMARIGDGWQKINGVHIWKDAKFRSLVINSELARIMEEKGFPIEYLPVDRKGEYHWRMEGSKPAVRKFFSTNSERKWRIQMAFEAKHGKKMTPIQLEAAMQKTKGKKNHLAKEADRGDRAYWAKLTSALEAEQARVTEEELQEWITKRHIAARFFPVGYEPTRKELEAAARDDGWTEDDSLTLSVPDVALGREISHEPLEDRLQILYARLEAPEGLVRDCDTESVFGPEIVAPSAFRAAVGLGLSADEVMEQAQWYIDNKLVLVRDASDPSARLYTTETVRAAEQDNAAWFEQLDGFRAEAVPEEIIAAVIADYDLAEDQAEALRLAGSDKALVFIRGPGGTGKTRLLQATAEMWRRAEVVRDVGAFATAGRRGVDTGRDVNATHMGSIHAAARRVAARKWIPSRRDAVVIDEGSMASTLDVAELRGAINRVGRLVIVMDDRQLEAIGPSGWQHRELALRSVAELTKVYRQSDERDRDAFLLIRDGYAHAALADLHERDRIHIAEDSASLPALVVDRWNAHRQAGHSVDDITVYFQGSNHDLDTLGRQIQRQRIRDHEDGRDDDFDPKQFFKMEETSTGRRWTVFKGDRGIFNEAYYDRINLPIKNGTTFKFLRVDRDGTCRVQLDTSDRRVVTIKLDAVAEVQKATTAYVISTTKGQGTQTKVGMVVPGNPDITSQNSLYTQTSRGIDHVDIIIDKEQFGPDPIYTLGVVGSRLAEKHTASERMEFGIYRTLNEDHVETDWEFEETENHELYVVDEVEVQPDEITEHVDARERVRALRETLERTERDSEGIGLGLSR